MKPAVDPVLFDQPIDEVGSSASESRQPLAALCPEHSDHLVRIPLQAREHSAAIALRSAKSGAAGVQDNYIGTAFTRRRAAERPVNPAPTMQMSTWIF